TLPMRVLQVRFPDFIESCTYSTRRELVYSGNNLKKPLKMRDLRGAIFKGFLIVSLSDANCHALQ
ncbi:MAG: hypothetical protein V3W14_09230, partial [Candidatus Neomarinimicrobiota bacterium]